MCLACSFLYYFSFCFVYYTYSVFHWLTFVYSRLFSCSVTRHLYPGTCLSCRCFHWFSSFHMCFSLLLFIFLILFETFEIQQYQITNVAFCLPMLLFFMNILCLMTITNKPQLYILVYPYAAHVWLQIFNVLCLKS